MPTERLAFLVLAASIVLAIFILSAAGRRCRPDGTRPRTSPRSPRSPSACGSATAGSAPAPCRPRRRGLRRPGRMAPGIPAGACAPMRRIFSRTCAPWLQPRRCSSCKGKPHVRNRRRGRAAQRRSHPDRGPASASSTAATTPPGVAVINGSLETPAQHCGRVARAGEARRRAAARGHDRHRPHALGHARRALGAQRPPARLRRRLGGAQRHHREPRGDARSACAAWATSSPPTPTPRSSRTWCTRKLQAGAALFEAVAGRQPASSKAPTPSR